jgi:hypothetical protein
MAKDRNPEVAFSSIAGWIRRGTECQLTGENMRISYAKDCLQNCPIWPIYDPSRTRVLKFNFNSKNCSVLRVHGDRNVFHADRSPVRSFGKWLQKTRPSR